MASLVPKKITGRDMEILYRHACGMKNKDIAEDLGLSDQTISNTVNSDWARNELALLHARTLDKIANGSYSPLHLARSVANEAMAIQITLMRSPMVKAQVRAKIADSILDRAGFKPATRIENLDLNDIFDKMTPEELDEYATTGTLPERFSGTQVSRFLAGNPGDSIEIEHSVSVGPDSDSVRNTDAIEIDIP